MRKALTFSTMLTVLGFASASFADDCDAPELNTFDAVYCINKVFMEEDARLNEAYGELRGFLNDNEKATLKAAQLN